MEQQDIDQSKNKPNPDAASSPIVEPPNAVPSAALESAPKAGDENLFKAYELYLSERTRLSAAKQDQSKSYDQTVLTYSAGAIALSITFLEKVVKTANGIGWLYTSWILFALAMITTLYSHLASQKAFEREIETFDARYRQLIGLKPVDAAAEQTVWGVTYPWLKTLAAMFSPALNSFSTAVKWLNRFSGALFFAGIVCFATFAIQNWTVRNEKETTAVAAPKIPTDTVRPSSPGTGPVPDPGVLPPIKIPQDKTPPPPSKDRT